MIMAVNEKAISEIKLLSDRLDREVIIDNGCVYVPHEIEAKFFDLLLNDRSSLLCEEAYPYTKRVNEVVLYALTHQEFKEGMSLKNGQMSYNGTAVLEYGLNKTLGWSFNGEESDKDHLYQHTGKGIGIADFVLTEPSVLTVWDPNGMQPHDVTAPAGTKIDAKSYLNFMTMKEALDKNVNGSLGHDASNLLINLITTNEYYLTTNIAGDQVYRVLNIDKLNTDGRYMVKLDVDENNILKVERLV